MSHLHILTPAEYRSMPWKNGKGVTLELFRSPPPQGEGLSDFDWRVSIALVPSDGPFSRFPGMDRLICVLEGAGMRLTHGEGVEARSVLPFQPHAFSGETTTDCQLLNGPVKDFNVMVKRAVSSARLTVLSREGSPGDARGSGQTTASLSDADLEATPGDGWQPFPRLRLLFCETGPCAVQLCALQTLLPGSNPSSPPPPGFEPQAVWLDTGEALLLDPDMVPAVALRLDGQAPYRLLAVEIGAPPGK